MGYAAWIALAAGLLSAAKTRSASALPVFLLVFLGCFLGLLLLYWCVLGFFALLVPMRRTYDAPSRFYQKLLNSGFRFLCQGARVRIHVTGLEKVPKNRRFLLVSNHLSRFDPMVQSLVLKQTGLAYISKPSNFKIPIGRHYMRRCCYLAIDRENPKNALETIKTAARLVQEDKVSMAVYPEGHRGSGAALQPFRPGCLKIAVLADAPILVTTIRGTENIHKNFPWRRTDVYFDILDVLEVNGRTTVSLSSEIKNRMQTHLYPDTGEINHDICAV